MSTREITKVGEFSLVHGECVALGYRFPSGFTVLEWVDIPNEHEELNHQSVYHSMDDLRTVYPDALIEWSGASIIGEIRKQ